MASLPRRWSRVTGYTLMCAAGIAAVAWPTPSVRAATGALVYLWAGFLGVGGLLAACGAVSDRWLGEYAGLPLIWAAFGVYAVVLGATARPAGVVAALVLSAVGLLVYARWRDVGVIRREATRQARRGTRR
ncbi:hypothetical protein ACN27G_05960 [Plantactinospora sp. WMMB334]|uniref:hypothetical protein n=1 Tax=Plantactinospora sp. WMMB334 TaxID=3404119 RepID=UPI003B923526